jgi:hypothetical protein
VNTPLTGRDAYKLFVTVCQIAREYTDCLETVDVNIWRDESGNWKISRNYESHILHSSPNLTKAIKPKTIKWAGNAACILQIHTFGSISLRDYVGDPDVVG